MDDDIAGWITELNNRVGNSIGYPLSKRLEHAWLPALLKLPLNNLGDPYVEGTYSLNSKCYEQEVLGFMAEAFRAPSDVWGYITSCGSEGNLFGLYAARTYLPDAPVYLSEATHYSVAKACDLLRMRAIYVRATAAGHMDYTDLRAKLKANGSAAAIVVANAGTVMHEARDDVCAIRHILEECGVVLRHVHVDAALAGAYLPYMEDREGFDFEDGADSISVSGHKFFGSPLPCGVVLVREERRALIGNSISYLDSVDSTIGGSRNAVAPVVLWSAISHLGRQGLQKRYQHCEQLAACLVEELCRLDIPAWKHQGAITVVLPRVPQGLIDRWDLASDNHWSHVIVVPGVEWDVLSRFLADVRHVYAREN